MKKSILIIGLVVFLASCGGDEIGQLKADKEKLETLITTSKAEIEEIEEKLEKLEDADLAVYSDVTSILVEQDVFEHYIKVQGVVEAGKMSMVTPEAGGIIVDLKVDGKEGTVIQKDDVIAIFDSETLISNIEELNVQIELAETMLKKQQSLYDQGLGNIIQLDQAKGQLAALKQSKNTAGTQKSKFVLKAPFTGVIEKVYVVEGQVAGPGSPIIMLVGKDDRKVRASISETYLKNINKGALVELEFPALDITISKLQVTRVGGFIDPVNRTVDIEVSIPTESANDKLVPNLMANIKIRDKVDSTAIMVPSKVIMKGSNQTSYVFVMTKDDASSNDSTDRYSVKKTEVTTGDMYDGKTIVLKGLSPNDMVVNRGRADVYEGNIVDVIKED
ncbi:MAG: membrane fusion protein (multidrug efflux system) [Flavobacteriales bacterium]|jgi:membrane fusion protein (multidrug efflux system)